MVRTISIHDYNNNRIIDIDLLSPSIGLEEEGDSEKDHGRMEKKEREKRKDSDSQPPPIPEKVCLITEHRLVCPFSDRNPFFF